MEWHRYPLVATALLPLFPLVAFHIARYMALIPLESANIARIWPKKREKHPKKRYFGRKTAKNSDFSWFFTKIPWFFVIFHDFSRFFVIFRDLENIFRDLFSDSVI